MTQLGLEEPRGWSSIAGVMLAGFCAFLVLYCTQPLLPLLSSEFHASKSQVSWTVSATTIAVAISAPFVGLLADFAGRKRVIVASILLVAIPTLLAAWSTTLHQLILCRFAQGLFMPGMFAVTIAYVTEEWPSLSVGRAMSAYVTATVVGGFCGRLVSGLVAEHYGWQASFQALGVFNLVGGLATWMWLPRSRQFRRNPPSRAALSAMRGHFKNRPLIAVYGTGAAVLFSLVGVFTYVTFYLAAPPFLLGPAALSSIFLVYLLGVVVTPLSGIFIDRFGPRESITYALVGSALGVALTLSHSLWLVTAGLAICSSGVFVCQSSATTYLRVVAPAATRSSAAGLYVGFYYAGGTLGGVIPGYLWNVGGWPLCVALVIAMQFAAALLVRRSWRPLV